MSLQATPPVEASALVTLRVPRGATGNLEAGVADVLANVDGVADVAVDGVTGVRPTWTDVRVDADVTLTVEPDATDGETDETRALASALTDGFGVIDVERLQVGDGE